MPDFEKPVIIRPKSTTDLWKLRRQKAEGTLNPETRPVLRIEQDLGRHIEKEGLEDEQDFEVWTEELAGGLQAAALETHT